MGIPLELDRRTLGHLGFGAAPIGLYPDQVSDRDADVLLEKAWEAGLRYFDTAAFYGGGRSERRMSRFIHRHRHEGLILSSKVGRSIVSDGQRPPANTENGTIQDFSAEAIRHQFVEACERMGTDSLDICYLHDPDNHLREACEESWPALSDLRSTGGVGSIGVGANSIHTLKALINNTDPDVIILANRLTLLDHGDDVEELLGLCAKRGITVVAAAVFNTGILATGAVPTARYEYALASAEIVGRVRQWEELCRGFAVPLGAAAVQFPLRDSRVSSALVGIRTTEELETNIRWVRWPIPEEMWGLAEEEGLIQRPNTIH